MRRPLTPLWLATPSRFAGLSQTAARVALALLGLLMLATLGALSLPASQTDTAFYAGIIDGVRHGGNYYAVTADALRADGYPLRPVLAFGLPTLAVVEAHLPWVVMTALLYALVAAVAWAWHRRLMPALTAARVRWFALLLLVLALLPMLRPSLLVVPETWAGLFIALSLAVRRDGRWLDAVALGLAAALIRETAFVYLLLMLAFAWADSARKEAFGWTVAIIIGLCAVAAHILAVDDVVRPLDTAADILELAGFGLFLEATAGGTVLTVLPLWLAAPLVGIALFGWAVWQDPTGLRVLVLLVATAVMTGLFGRGDTAHWPLLVAPLVPLGLLFAVDGIRDLLGTALDRRRITVTRIAR